MSRNFVLKGNICYSEDKDTLRICENGYVVCENGISGGVFRELPERYRTFAYHDCGDRLIIPGLVDLHLHAPQYAFRGLGMDLELIDWLNTHTFPEEAKYANLEYARSAYEIFVEDLIKSGTTRACVFATVHKNATLLLMEMLEEAGIGAYVGKVNMDRNSPDELREKSSQISAEDTECWLRRWEGHGHLVKPILTPRFTPSCSDKLMKELSRIQKTYHLPLQSHLSENQGEIAWVSELCPDTGFYGESYDRYGLFGGECPTIMAHCVYSGAEEIERMHSQNVFVAHCPQSNTNLSSGIAPIRTYLEKGVKTGLGSDIAAGSSLSILRAMADAIQCSKLRWRLVDQSLSALKIEEAFFLGTKGGGEFFEMAGGEKVGSLEEGYAFDAVVLDDSRLRHPQELSVRDRLERMICLSDDRNVSEVYVQGRKTYDSTLA